MRLCSSLLKNIASFLLPDLQKKKGLNEMITRFMRDTPLAAIEIEMQLIPSFTPRASGTFRSQQRYVNPNPIGIKNCWGCSSKRQSYRYSLCEYKGSQRLRAISRKRGKPNAFQKLRSSPMRVSVVWLFTLIVMFLREKCIASIHRLRHGMLSCGLLHEEFFKVFLDIQSIHL